MPHLVPLDRGILETIYVAGARRARPTRRLPAAYAAAYAGARFVRITGTTLPVIKQVA